MKVADTLTMKELYQAIDRRAADLEEKVIAWRREIHQHPELGNREFRTAELVERHLRSLDIEVRSKVAHTGVIGTLHGGQVDDTRQVIALRADMDALPVTEDVDVPFASKVRTQYDGQEVGVMHACGHDTHVAILLGVAEVLASLRKDLPGSVKFLFQPAEEGPPAGEEGGAALMIREGALENPSPDAVFALHVTSRYEVGTIAYRPGPAMAAVDTLYIDVRGRQTHGAYPWYGVDPIVVASQIILGLQTVASRQLDASHAASIITIGMIRGGVRNNIIPESVQLVGTLRSLDMAMRDEMHARVKRTAEKIAESAGASADVRIEPGYPITYNDPALTAQMLPTLTRVRGAGGMLLADASLGAEDFSFYQQTIPGLFFWLGTRPPNLDVREVGANHSPRFFVDESGLLLGVRALAHCAVDFLYQNG